MRKKTIAVVQSAEGGYLLTQLGIALGAKVAHRWRSISVRIHCVNDKAINAFALPGGYVLFINTRRDSKPRYERRKTSGSEWRMSSRMSRWPRPLTGHKAIWGNRSGIFRRQYSRTPPGAPCWATLAISLRGRAAALFANGGMQSDVMGTEVLYDRDTTPRAMAQFFEKLEAENKGKILRSFFSDHPIRKHRVRTRGMNKLKDSAAVPQTQARLPTEI